MKKNLLLYILLVFLIIVNGFFLFNSIGKTSGGKQNERQRPGDFIIKELGFNELQLEQFRALNHEHHRTMRHLSDGIKELKDDLFDELTVSPINDILIDSITSLIGKRQKEKETEVFYHLRSIQEICNSKQKEKFKNIIIDALQKGGGKDKPPHRRGDERRPPPPKH